MFNFDKPALERDGYCLCGCGLKTPIAHITRNERGDKKGYPLRFIAGHVNKSKIWRESVGKWTHTANWNGGKTIHQGYVLRHKNTFTEDEYNFLKPMFLHYHKRGLYIPEHRAIVALMEGRLLSLDGDRKNNSFENIILGSARDNYNDHDSSRKEVMKLRIENEKLKEELQKLKVEE